jgi:hypothetical protein
MRSEKEIGDFIEEVKKEYNADIKEIVEIVELLKLLDILHKEEPYVWRFTYTVNK